MLLLRRLRIACCGACASGWATECVPSPGMGRTGRGCETRTNSGVWHRMRCMRYTALHPRVNRGSLLTADERTRHKWRISREPLYWGSRSRGSATWSWCADPVLRLEWSRRCTTGVLLRSASPVGCRRARCKRTGPGCPKPATPATAACQISVTFISVRLVGLVDSRRRAAGSPVWASTPSRP